MVMIGDMETSVQSHRPVILFKYGGNAMVDNALKRKVLQSICKLTDQGFNVVVVHGGGPFIKQALQDAEIESEFIDGHRKTTTEAFEYVEMALKGKVNGNLVSIINSLGYKAVGLSGKDGRTVVATKRFHQTEVEGKTEPVDLGQVGDVKQVNPSLLRLLLRNGFIPVITCLADDENGNGFNINGDMFAGHVAGALQADHYVVLTDVDGLLRDKDDPNSLIRNLTLLHTRQLLDEGIIRGGMIPKTESCEIALKHGAGAARIINGTKPEQIAMLMADKPVGTTITKS